MEHIRHAKKFSALGLIGIILALIQMYHHVAVRIGYQKGPSFCSFGQNFDCDVVARSPQAEFLGFPIASYALLYYLLVFGISRVGRGGRSHSAEFLFSIANLAIIPTLYMAYVSAVQLHTWCLLCALMYFLNFVLIVLTWGLLPEGRSPLTHLLMGLRHIFWPFEVFFLRSRVEEETRQSLGLSAMLLAIYFSFSLPSFLVLQIFVPRMQSAENAQMNSQVVTEWQKSSAVDLRIKESASLHDTDFVYGPSDAKITLVEFSDFECPFCRQLTPQLKHLVDASQGRIRLVHKAYPLDQSCHPAVDREMHKHSCKAEIMARCAGEQGKEKFWAMHDAIYGLGWVDDDSLGELPTKLGLNSDQFQACLWNSATKTRVQEDIKIGIDLGVRGTPMVFINGKPLAAPSIEAIEQILKGIS